MKDMKYIPKLVVNMISFCKTEKMNREKVGIGLFKVLYIILHIVNENLHHVWSLCL